MVELKSSTQQQQINSDTLEFLLELGFSLCFSRRRPWKTVANRGGELQGVLRSGGHVSLTHKNVQANELLYKPQPRQGPRSQVREIEERFGSEVGARLGTTEGQERLKAKDVNRTTNVRRFVGLRGSSLAPVRFLTPQTSGRGLKIAITYFRAR